MKFEYKKEFFNTYIISAQIRRSYLNMTIRISGNNQIDGQNTNSINKCSFQSDIPPIFNFSLIQDDEKKDDIILQHMKETQAIEEKAEKYAKTRINKSVQVAQQELKRGVKEEVKMVNGKYQGSNDSPRIALYKGRHDNNAWCSSFVNYACSASQGKGNLFGMDKTYAEHNNVINASASQAVRLGAEKNGILHDPRTKEGQKYKPKAGDLIVWTAQKGYGGHIGMVEKVNPDGSFTTIEGNTNDALKRRTYNSVTDATRPKNDNRKNNAVSENYNGTILTGFIDMEEYYKKENLGTLKKADKRGKFR